MEPLPIDGRLRKAALRMPDEIEEASGFTLFGRRIKSLIYTTDVAVIRNSNADAVFAVYPFTPQPAITQALLTVAECPVFVGVGGGTTTGKRSVRDGVSPRCRARRAVWSTPQPPPRWSSTPPTSPTSPVIRHGLRCDDDAHERCARAPRILTSRPARTRHRVLRELREHYPNLPLIAPGGKTPESIRETIAAGANAIIWTPPSAQHADRHDAALPQDEGRRHARHLARRYTHYRPGCRRRGQSGRELNPDVPIPDEVIERVASIHDHIEERRANRGLKPSLHGFFFRGKKR